MDVRISDRERRCLLAWEGVEQGYCLNFKGVGRGCDIEHHNIRRVVRALARKGLLSFQRGLFDESDGSVAGSGYGLTDQGAIVLDELTKVPA